MVLSEAQALWGKEISRLEQLTGKKIVTLQDGIDAIKSRIEGVNTQERLSDKSLDIIECLEVWADALTTLVLADRKHQDYLREETTRRITAINSMWDRLK